MSGYHKCPHCYNWHDCEYKEPSGCLVSIAGFVALMVMFGFLYPLFKICLNFWEPYIK